LPVAKAKRFTPRGWKQCRAFAGKPLILIKGRRCAGGYLWSPGSDAARLVGLRKLEELAAPADGQAQIWARRRVIMPQDAINQFRLAATFLCLSASVASAQDPAAGQISFSRCVGCHSIGVDAKNKNGPQLNALEGRKCGSVEGYVYSNANKDCAFTWNEANFVEYIRDPKAKIPGTRKSISGIRDLTEAKNLWAYLRQFGPNGLLK
jgi:cytochrome c